MTAVQTGDVSEVELEVVSVFLVVKQYSPCEEAVLLRTMTSFRDTSSLIESPVSSGTSSLTITLMFALVVFALSVVLLELWKRELWQVVVSYFLDVRLWLCCGFGGD